MKPTPTLYLLASEGGFRLLRTAENGLADVAQVEAASLPDMPVGIPGAHGRQLQGPSGAMFGTGEASRHEELTREAIARHATTALEGEWRNGDYQRIAISAGPKMLGALRDALPKPLAAKVAAELHKDLMQFKDHELPEHFKGALPY